MLSIASPVNKYTEANITIDAIKRHDIALAILFFRLSGYCTMLVTTWLNQATPLPSLSVCNYGD